MAFIASTEHLPIIKIFSALLRDWMPLIDKYHYCASALSLLSVLMIDLMHSDTSS
jgi:hypothetical protein